VWVQIRVGFRIVSKPSVRKDSPACWYLRGPSDKKKKSQVKSKMKSKNEKKSSFPYLP
jgi:hypothetical protein